MHFKRAYAYGTSQADHSYTSLARIGSQYRILSTALYTNIENTSLLHLLLARLMGLYHFARWRLSSSVTLPVGGPAAVRMGGRAADAARRASTVTSR